MQLEDVAAEATEAAGRAKAVAADIEALLWWEEGRIFGAYDVARSVPLRGIGAMGLLPAASRALAESEVTQRLAVRHLGPGGPMWGPHGFAAGKIDPGTGVGSFVQWDGNAVWGATVYWAYLVAARLDLWSEARRLHRQLRGLIDAHGFREFYDACTGQPGGAGDVSGFSWPALALDMTDPSE